MPKRQTLGKVSGRVGAWLQRWASNRKTAHRVALGVRGYGWDLRRRALSFAARARQNSLAIRSFAEQQPVVDDHPQVNVAEANRRARDPVLISKLFWPKITSLLDYYWHYC